MRFSIEPDEGYPLTLSSPTRERENFPLDNIPRCVYMVSICSKKEAVIAKPHLFC